MQDLRKYKSEIEFPIDQALPFAAKLYYCMWVPHYVAKYAFLRLGLFIFLCLMALSLSGEWP